MFKAYGLVALALGAFISTAQAGTALVIAPNIRIGAPAYDHRPDRRMDPQRLARLKADMEDRTAEMLDPAPEGLRREEYRYFDRRPEDGPCDPGYREVQNVPDPVLTGRFHFRCVSETRRR